MAVLFLFSLVILAIRLDEKYTSKRAPSNYYSSERPINRSIKFYPISQEHRHFHELKDTTYRVLKRHLRAISRKEPDLERLIKATDNFVLKKIVSNLLNPCTILNHQLNMKRQLIVLKILLHETNITELKEKDMQLVFQHPIADNVQQLLNKLEDQMILQNRISIVRSMNNHLSKMNRS